MPIIANSEAARDALGRMWQVEGAVLALITAAALFSFESLARFREEVPLREYAARSGLPQFLMLGASGLLSVGIALLWSDDHVPAAAAGWALSVSMLGLAAVPFLFHQALDVVDPTWFREQQLQDAETAMQRLVADEALERAALLELQEWASDHHAQIAHRIASAAGRVLESSPTEGTTWDLDLGVLAGPVSDALDEIVIGTRIGEELPSGAQLIVTNDDAARLTQPSVTVVAVESASDKVDDLVTRLRAEGLQAVRSESQIAIESVMKTYATVWTAWPKAWSEFGQRATGGLIRGLEPFQPGLTHQLHRDALMLLEASVDRGLRAHVNAVTSIPWKVGSVAIRSLSDDVLESMASLSHSFLTSTSSRHPELTKFVIDRGWRFQVEATEVYAGPKLEDDTLSIEDRVFVADRLVGRMYESMARSLKVLHDLGRYDAFRALDHRYRLILSHWRIEPDDYTARAIIADPDRYASTPEEVARAHDALALAEAGERLVRLRQNYRLTVLAWILHRGLADDLAGSTETLRELVTTLGPVDEVVRAAGDAISYRSNLMSDWLIMDQREMEVGSIDSEGPVLRALSVFLLSRPSILQIEAAPWIDDRLIDRLTDELHTITEWEEVVSALSLTLEEAANREAELLGLIRSAGEERRGIERDELITQPLDLEKVELFKVSVSEGWRNSRVVDGLVDLAGAQLEALDEDEFESSMFGFPPSLEPKGLFITPSSFVGHDDYGRDLGRNLALSEVRAVIGMLRKESEAIEASGPNRERVAVLIDDLRRREHEPTVLFASFDWRLARSLDLSEQIPTRRGEQGIAHYLAGYVDGIPLIQWARMPDDRVFAVDLRAFVRIQEAVDMTGHAMPPTVDFTEVDEDQAQEIARCSEDGAGDEEPEPEPERVAELMTRIRLDLKRPFVLTLLDSGACGHVIVGETRE